MVSRAVYAPWKGTDKHSTSEPLWKYNQSNIKVVTQSSRLLET